MVIAKSLPLARQWAQESCWHDPSTGESCGWYHGAWQTLRLLGVVSTLTHHANLYIQALRPLIEAGECRRVFLSGSADYGLLSVVLDAFAETSAQPEITVVDRCATPLNLCRWYAAQYGYAIETVQSDLADYRSAQPFDVICVHSLLSCVPVEAHAGVVTTWRDLLRLGGTLMMANTLYPAIPAKKVSFSPEDVIAYRGKVAKAAQNCSQLSVLPGAEELDQMAEAFALRMEGSVIGSREQLTDLLAAGGFKLATSRFGNLISDPKHTRTGPPGIKTKEYAWIIARRR